MTKNLKYKIKYDLKSKIKYDKTKIKQFHDTRYYEKLQDNINQAELIKTEKENLRTRKNEELTQLIDEYNEKREEKSEQIAKKLKAIYNKNKECAYNGKNIINAKLLGLVSSKPMLMIAYKKVRKNKGAMTPGHILPDKEYDELEPEQRNLYNKTIEAPDGITMEIIELTSKLLRIGKYPWGASNRVKVDKPGSDKKRPITIPPFMDRVVQFAIKMILEAIYEPYFDKLNCSFGFRPGKGCHDAIYSITNRAKSTGLWNALEGDIKSAYDKVNRNTLIKILSKKIKDRKFLNLIKMRLDYQYFEKDEQKYTKDKIGLPQGGTDSPYLWNIYTLGFDEFFKIELTKEIEELNKKRRIGKGRTKLDTKSIPSPLKRYLTRLRQTLRTFIRNFHLFKNTKELDNFFKVSIGKKKEILQEKGELLYFPVIRKDTNWNAYYKNGKNNKIKNDKDEDKELRIYKYQLINYKRLINHRFHRVADTDKEKRLLRFVYCRYADDFILITNFKLKFLTKLKERIRTKLEKELDAELSMEKIKITDLRKDSARFLGFEIRTIHSNKQTKFRKLGNKIKGRTASGRIYVYPDTQRLIDRYTMKGFCDETGFPREIGKLIHLEPHMIINRYNEIIRGFALYYTQFVRAPRKTLSRWIYILRFSCMKTLAMKESTRLTKIFKKYKDNSYKKYYEGKTENTIGTKVIMNLNGRKYQKKWTLLVDRQAYGLANEVNMLGTVMKRFWCLEKGETPDYSNMRNPMNITSDNFIEKVDWINLRTQASFDLPCCICGDPNNIQMHHIRHVNKSTYRMQDDSWRKIMGIKNRKQIPVCQGCHMQMIHRGQYGGQTKFSYLKPKIMFDNRIITIEGKISKKGNHDDSIYNKTLLEKGWKEIKN